MWDKLTLKDKAELMSIFVKNGITDLSQIKSLYNGSFHKYDGISENTQQMNTSTPSFESQYSEQDNIRALGGNLYGFGDWLKKTFHREVIPQNTEELYDKYLAQNQGVMLTPTEARNFNADTPNNAFMQYDPNDPYSFYDIIDPAIVTAGLSEKDARKAERINEGIEAGKEVANYRDRNGVPLVLGAASIPTTFMAVGTLPTVGKGIISSSKYITPGYWLSKANKPIEGVLADSILGTLDTIQGGIGTSRNIKNKEYGKALISGALTGVGGASDIALARILNPRVRALQAYENIYPFGYDSPILRGKQVLKGILEDKPVYLDNPHWAYQFEDLDPFLRDFNPELKNSGKLAIEGRKAAFKKYLGLPDDSGIYIPNENGTFRYNLDKIQEITEGTWRPAFDSFGNEFPTWDYVTTAGGNLDVANHVKVGVQKSHRVNDFEQGYQHISDTWDLTPFQNRNLIRAYLSSALNGKFNDKIWGNKLLTKLDNKLNNFEIGPILGGKPFKMDTKIPYTITPQARSEALDNVISRKNTILNAEFGHTGRIYDYDEVLTPIERLIANDINKEVSLHKKIGSTSYTKSKHSLGGNLYAGGGYLGENNIFSKFLRPTSKQQDNTEVNYGTEMSLEDYYNDPDYQAKQIFGGKEFKDLNDVELTLLKNGYNDAKNTLEAAVVTGVKPKYITEKAYKQLAKDAKSADKYYNRLLSNLDSETEDAFNSATKGSDDLDFRAENAALRKQARDLRATERRKDKAIRRGEKVFDRLSNREAKLERNQYLRDTKQALKAEKLQEARDNKEFWDSLANENAFLHELASGLGKSRKLPSNNPILYTPEDLNSSISREEILNALNIDPTTKYGHMTSSNPEEFMGEESVPTYTPYYSNLQGPGVSPIINEYIKEIAPNLTSIKRPQVDINSYLESPQEAPIKEEDVSRMYRKAEARDRRERFNEKAHDAVATALEFGQDLGYSLADAYTGATDYISSIYNTVADRLYNAKLDREDRIALNQELEAETAQSQIDDIRDRVLTRIQENNREKRSTKTPSNNRLSLGLETIGEDIKDVVSSITSPKIKSKKEINQLDPAVVTASRPSRYILPEYYTESNVAEIPPFKDSRYALISKLEQDSIDRYLDEAINYDGEFDKEELKRRRDNLKFFNDLHNIKAEGGELKIWDPKEIMYDPEKAVLEAEPQEWMKDYTYDDFYKYVNSPARKLSWITQGFDGWKDSDLRLLYNNLGNFGWDPRMAVYAMEKETNFRPYVKNKVSSAVGLGQLTKDTIKRFHGDNADAVYDEYINGTRSIKDVINDTAQYYKWSRDRLTTEPENMGYGRLKVNLLAPNASLDSLVSEALYKNSLTSKQKKNIVLGESTYRDLMEMYNEEYKKDTEN